MKRLRFIPCQDGTLLNAAEVTRLFLRRDGWVGSCRVLAADRGSDICQVVGEYASEEGARLALGRLFRHLNGIPRGGDGDEGGPR